MAQLKHTVSGREDKTRSVWLHYRMAKISPYLITDQTGFTPHIGRLVSMMNYARRTTLEMVRGLSMEELDFLPSPEDNSIGMLLEHMAAVEFAYQVLTFEQREATDSELEPWNPGLELGQLGREHLRGKEVSHYLNTLGEVRSKTLGEFAKRNDDWLHQEFPLWGQQGNNYFCWFHVFEDEINHRGQIRLIRKQLPRFKNRGMLGVQMAPATEDGKGMKLAWLDPNGPAGLAGLKPGDIVVYLDGQAISHLPTEEILLQGQAGEKVRFSIRREGHEELLDFEAVRVKP